MKYYIDTEFLEDGHENPIRLISLGIVSSDGREYYAEDASMDLSLCGEWLQKNVIPYLNGPRKDRPTIAREVLEFVGWGPCIECNGRGYLNGDSYYEGLTPRRVLCATCDGRKESMGPDKPEFWGYFADYDWVLFCQLFGRMIDLPKGLPMFCNDTKQLANMLGISRGEFPAHLGNAHNALDDARWTRDLHSFLLKKLAKKMA